MHFPSNLLSKPFSALLLGVAMVGTVACGPPTGPAPDPGDRAPCGYPAAVEPMAENEPMAAYRWEVGKLADGSEVTLDFAAAHCDSDVAIDWSPFDVLLFVSIPAW